MVRDSGVEDVSGFGISSIAIEKGLYRTKSLLHHYPGKGTGFLWNLMGQKAHPMTSLGLLSTNTALATFSDLDLALLWSVIQKQSAQSGFPQATDLLQKAQQGFEEATGLKWDQVLASLGGEFGFTLLLDDTKKISIPLPGGTVPLEIPEPGLMLVAKVKDDLILNRVDQALEKLGQPIVRVDKPNLKMRTVPLPLPLPISLRPSLALAEGYLFLATTDTLITEALA